ncbi:SigE family RNA polymerase sigma factor [Catenulispora sp. NF23]|nr:SigE family RNA polymerase sigma factor [Catenulispora pinistramenti]MBS2539656.1 SigE family RNA polymerase sigma factor [Catenulispora pinistramenti]
MRLTDEAEFKEYAAAQSLALRRTAYLMCGDWHQAEDLVQTALLRLYRSWSKVQRSGSRDAYVRQVLVRCLIDERRRSWRRERPFAELPETGLHMRDGDGMNGEGANAGSGFEIRLGHRDEIFAALAKLPPRQRATLVLRYWEDMSVEQAAHAMGCTVGTVKSQSARGLSALRVLLRPIAEPPISVTEKEWDR